MRRNQPICIGGLPVSCRIITERVALVLSDRICKKPFVRPLEKAQPDEPALSTQSRSQQENARHSMNSVSDAARRSAPTFFSSASACSRDWVPSAVSASRKGEIVITGQQRAAIRQID